MRKLEVLAVCFGIAAFGFAGQAIATPTTTCLDVSSCTVGGETFSETNGTSGNGLIFLASWTQTPKGQDPASISASALAFLYADGGIQATYLGRAGDSSTSIDGDSVSITGSNNPTGTWTLNPGTTGDVGAYVVIHAGDGQTDELFSITSPGLTGDWGTNNGHGESNFDLLGVDPTPVPEPMTLSLFGAGLAGAVVMRRRKKKS